MCYKGKCFYCIPVKTPCLVLAIINAVVNGLVFMWYVFFWGFVFLAFGFSGKSPIYSGGDRWKRDVSVDRLHSDTGHRVIDLIWWNFLLPMFALVNCIFSVLLCDGICKSRPKHVKAYFWYGVVVTVVVAMVSVVLLCIDLRAAMSEIIWLLGCVLHSLFLVMVHQTHKKVVEDTMLNGRVPLDDLELSDKERETSD